MIDLRLDRVIASPAARDEMVRLAAQVDARGLPRGPAIALMHLRKLVEMS